ncbi:MAG: Serine/threonine-protein kinase PK-1 [Candidatus Hydrogenedentes bacterium ADurb.Bin101]|nr:MAG: Serine/threonine-protein kinase PK-1 [Candidatus Hydrogenedentes bacterium ADurb.Bin101]
MNLVRSGSKMNLLIGRKVLRRRGSLTLFLCWAMVAFAAMASVAQGEFLSPPGASLNALSSGGELSPYHPADVNTNWRLVMSEAISYLTGWQQGTNPMAFAIRAAYLWQAGEFYSYDPSLNLPLCWTPFLPGEGESEAQIGLNSPEITTVECGSVFVDPGATAQDADGTPLAVDTAITLDGVPIDGIVPSLEALGSVYLINYSAQPAGGGPITVTRTVTIQDTQPPVIAPALIQTFGLFEFGYRDFVVNWEWWPSYYHVHQVSCSADWANMDSGTALDACGVDGPVDYWEDVEVTVRLLHPWFQVQQDEYGNDITVDLAEFTNYPGLYRLDYLVTDAAGNTGVYEAVEYMRYVEVFDTTLVPFVGGYALPVADAVALIEAVSLVPEITEEHNDLSAGTVISQTPAGGAEVPCGSVVQLLVSLGPCFVPNLSGMTQQEAEAAIEAAGYVVGSVDTAPSTAPEGTVILQFPNAGEPVACGSSVTITLSEGACVMPDVAGEPVADALAAIEAAGFTDITLIETWAANTSGTVITQIPGPGMTECNTPVEVAISLGPEPEIITLYGSDPDVAECNEHWIDPGADVYGGSDMIAGPIYAVVEYQSGEVWVPIDPASDTLLTANSPYRATYRYEYDQPGTAEPGLLEEVRMIEVLDTIAPQLTLLDNPSYIEPESGTPVYLAGCAEYTHWDEVAAAFSTELVEIYDQCDGYLPVESIEVDLTRIYPGYENPLWPGELYGVTLESLGLDEHTWLNAPGAYLAVWTITDASGNRGGDAGFVVICAITETNIAGIGLYGASPMTVETGSTWEAVRPEVSSHNFLPAAGAYAWDDDPLNTPLPIVSEVLTDKHESVVPFTEALNTENAPYTVTYTSANTTNAGTPLTVTREILVTESL